jgi:hypothetical protein
VPHPHRSDEGRRKGHTASSIENHGKAVTVPTDERHRIGFAEAKAEAYAAQHHASKPDEARAAQDKGIGSALKDMVGLP